jgi:hypothetical protein
MRRAPSKPECNIRVADVLLARYERKNGVIGCFECFCTTEKSKVQFAASGWE